MDNSYGDRPWLDGIEGDDLPRLIESDAKVIRVVAGPGSGKTTGLKRRIRRRIQGDGIDPERIFVGTFTRAIANDLERSLDIARNVRTLHSLAYRILREHLPALAGRRLRFLLEFEEEAMLCDIAEHVEGNDHERKTQLRRLQAAWARRDLPDARFWGAAERWLRFHGGMLIGEVPHLAATALANGDIPAGMYDDVIIDEYQDLTACEQQLVELVWSRVGSLVVLGDDDQSVYGFRFNHPEGITGFPGHWQDVEDIAFPDNRRCATSIVEIANQLMAEAGSTKDPMVARAADEGSAAFVQWPSVEEEIAGLADFVGSRPDDEFLILVPRRFIGYRLQEAIGADARTAFRQEVLEHPLTQERFTLASLLADSEDRVAFRAWLCFHGDQPTKPTGRNADAYSSFSASGASPMDIARDIVSGAIRVRGTGSTHIRERASRMVTELATAPGDFHELVDYIFNPDLADTLPADLADEKRRWVRSDLEQIRDAALKIRDEDEDATLAQVIRVLRYRIATRAPLSEEQPARVNIMTLHSAKGLEADAIIVAGLADQIVPGPPDQDPQTNDNQRAEQRRLLYVAVTRAKNELVVSWPRSVAYADASVNRIRIDAGSIRSYGSGRRVQLTRSSLLPDDLPGATPGRAWLKSRSG